VAGHTTLAERRAAALRMGEALPCLGEAGIVTLADGMDDRFLETYAAWPVRLFGVRRDGTLGAIAQPRGGAFHLAPLREWLLGECART
jgi:hypothetical protein